LLPICIFFREKPFHVLIVNPRIILIKGKNYSEKTKRILRRFFDRPFNVDESNPSSVTTINKTLLSYSGKRDVLVRGSLRTERKAGLDYLFATGIDDIFSMTCNFFSKTKFPAYRSLRPIFIDCFPSIREKSNIKNANTRSSRRASNRARPSEIKNYIDSACGNVPCIIPTMRVVIS